MGRNRLPTAIQDAKGAYLKDPQRKRDAEPTTDRPLGPPPTYLTPEEKKVWKQLAKQALPGVLMQSDRLMFSVLVRLANKHYVGVPMLASETAQMIQLSSKFAMNAADRSKVSVDKPEQDDLAKFIAGGKPQLVKSA
jgi:hypothetical protein